MAPVSQTPEHTPMPPEHLVKYATPAARAEVPELLAEVQRLREELVEERAHVEKLTRYHHEDEAQHATLREELSTERRRSAELREREAGAHDQLATAVGVAGVMVWPDLIARVTHLAARPSRAEVLRQAAVTIRTDAGLREAEGDHGLAAEIRALADLIDPDEADTIDERRRCPQSCTDPLGTVYRCPKPAGHDTHGADDWSWTTCHHRANGGEDQ